MSLALVADFNPPSITSNLTKGINLLSVWTSPHFVHCLPLYIWYMYYVFIDSRVHRLLHTSMLSSNHREIHSPSRKGKYYQENEIVNPDCILTELLLHVATCTVVYNYKGMFFVGKSLQWKGKLFQVTDVENLGRCKGVGGLHEERNARLK